MTSFIRRMQIRLARRIRKTLNASDTTQHNETSRLAGSIFRLSLRDKNAELLLMPVKDKRIIKIEKRGMYIVLEKSLLEITNHQYSYHLEISFELYTKLNKAFDKKLDELSSEQEKAIVSQMSDGLRKVLNTITE